ncbi:hypothetical protein Cantr_02470 [Candida viswanathii]|uniref:Uncharacterized protein n=1 Tax=Candida viswanathii TaxID=5486 RepID=A0A367YMX6_9ASCO|nr:hypothetical protein Cantr_02470 [Candida viswanathii]
MSQSQTTAKFQLHSTLSSSLEEPPSPTHSASNSSSQQSRNEKYHKAIKKSLNKMSFAAPANYSENDIFERTCQSHGNLINPGTPSHYNLENYTSPVLDTITNNPLNAVTLNCFCEEEDDNEEDDENAQQPYTGPSSSSSQQHNHLDKTSSIPEQQEQINHHEDTSSHTPPFIRPRARSIISQSLISTLNHKNNTSSANRGYYNHGSGAPHIHPSASTTGVASLSFHPVAKRLKSYAGQTHVIKDKVDANAIDFYSFADMNQKENEQESYATTTISAKDYVGRF